MKLNNVQSSIDAIGASIFSGENTERLNKAQAAIDTLGATGCSSSSDVDLTNYVQKENGKDLFSGSYNDLTDKPNYGSKVFVIEYEDGTTETINVLTQS